jgi:effector-binding domain-containing protein
MKILKVIILSLVVLVAIAAVVGFISPAHVHVERSLTIKAPSEIIHSQINELKNWTKWSPWYKMDSTMQIEYNTVASGAGAGYKWVSNDKKVGCGEMTITSSTKDSISTAMNFSDNGIATANFILSGSGNPNDSSNGQTNVTWTMDMDMGMNPVGRIFGLFMDKMVGSDFENGLKNLKKISEAVPARPKTYRGFEVLEENTPERIYIVKKDSMNWDKIEEFYARNLPDLLEALAKSKLEIAGLPSSLYFKWDSISKTAVMAVAVPVNADIKTKIKGYETMAIPAGKNLRIMYQGGYTKIGGAHMAIDEYMKEKKLRQQNPVIEEYISGPGKETDSTKWITNVYYRVI